MFCNGLGATPWASLLRLKPAKNITKRNAQTIASAVLYRGLNRSEPLQPCTTPIPFARTGLNSSAQDYPVKAIPKRYALACGFERRRFANFEQRRVAELWVARQPRR